MDIQTERKGGVSRIKPFIRLMRPAQWIKNFFVFLPPFLNGDLTDWSILWHTIIAFILFCLTSSAVYSINDAVDAPFDAKNPEKCHRRVASGAISRTDAMRCAVILILFVSATLLLIPSASIYNLAFPLGIYLVLNLAYSLYLKRIPVLDVLIVAGCFLIRVWAGGVAGPVPLTSWTLILVFMLTLFMATGKRRHEVWLCETKGIVGRSNIKHYSLKALTVMMIVLGVASVVLYLVWSLSPIAISHFHTDKLWITTIFAMLGIYRYLYLTLRLNRGGSPTKMVMNDCTLQLAILLWVLNFIVIIHVPD